MALIGYHASHEQFRPSELLNWAKLAASCGFEAINCSDHFHPWSERQGQSGFSFAWLGAAMVTSTLPFGVVCAPGQRYNPAIVAQAIGTLAEMFPSRLWVALGSGEALNERITGERWPPKPERNERLRESYDVIKRLLEGDTVTHHGLVHVEEAKLYTRPQQQPLIVGAAVTVETARWMGSWAEGLITISGPLHEMQKVHDAFTAGGGNGKPMYLKVQLSYAETYEEALTGAFDQWRTNIFAGSVLSDLWKVEQFDALGDHVQPQELKDKIIISSDTDEYVDLLNKYIAMGFERIILHNVNRAQETFIRHFGEHVLPRLNR
jgi:coenzyme F420-dependent glucose-6-phosphate dehydrogenase